MDLANLLWSETLADAINSIIEAYERAVSLGPDNEVAWRKIGELSQWSNPVIAIRAWEQVVKLDPRDARALVDLGLALQMPSQVQDIEKAIDCFEQAVSIALKTRTRGV